MIYFLLRLGRSTSPEVASKVGVPYLASLGLPHNGMALTVPGM